MQIEGISRQDYWDTVIRSNIYGRRSRTPDPLHRDLLWCQRNLVLLRLFHDGVNKFLIGLVRICPAGHRDVPEIVLE